MDASPFSSSSKIEMSQLLLQLRVARAWVANKGDSRKGIRHPPTLLITIRHPGLQKQDDTNNQSKLKYFNVVWMSLAGQWLKYVGICGDRDKYWVWWQISGMVTCMDRKSPCVFPNFYRLQTTRENRAFKMDRVECWLDQCHPDQDLNLNRAVAAEANLHSEGNQEKETRVLTSSLVLPFNQTGSQIRQIGASPPSLEGEQHHYPTSPTYIPHYIRLQTSSSIKPLYILVVLVVLGCFQTCADAQQMILSRRLLHGSSG